MSRGERKLTDAELAAKLADSPWERMRAAAEGSGERPCVVACAWCKTRVALPGGRTCGEYCEAALELSEEFG